MSEQIAGIYLYKRVVQARLYIESHYHLPVNPTDTPLITIALTVETNIREMLNENFVPEAVHKEAFHGL